MRARKAEPENRLRPDALVVGYALSRLNRSLLSALGYGTWDQAYAATSAALEVKHNSIKLLRDEFDVFFPNGRRGWLLREPHPSRLAILREFESVSDVALVEVVRRILAKDQESVQDILKHVREPAVRVANVAERLLTGRRAEEHFMRTCQEIIGVPSGSLADLRHTACGFDFSTDRLPGVALEIKGMKVGSGGILFTEREWTEAQALRQDYWVIVIGNLDAAPAARVYQDPTRVFEAKCQIVRSASTVWSAQASVV
ncbi:MAG: DUF3883 domain-containing protein [Fimbriimonas sp.]|nr:DUF3883 domain-containing protein [Fimbriimonas sp.]